MAMLTFVSDFHSQKVVGTSYFYEAGRTYDVPPEILDEVLSSGAVGMTEKIEIVADASPELPVETPIEPSEEAAYDDDAQSEAPDADDAPTA